MNNVVKEWNIEWVFFLGFKSHFWFLLDVKIECSFILYIIILTFAIVKSEVSWYLASIICLTNSQVALVVKNPTCQYRRRKRWTFEPWVRKIPWRRAWKHTPVFLPGESHGQRSPNQHATVHRVAKSQTQLKSLNTHTHTHDIFNFEFTL